MHQVVTEVEQEGDEAGGGHDGNHQEATDVGRPAWLSLHYRSQPVAEVSLTAPHTSAPDTSQQMGKYLTNHEDMFVCYVTLILVSRA